MGATVCDVNEDMIEASLVAIDEQGAAAEGPNPGEAGSAPCRAPNRAAM
jgi:hypothetical protein